MGEFTHFNKEGNAVMVDVHAKDDTYRVAVAAGKIYVNKEVYAAIKGHTAKKGDVLGVAAYCRDHGGEEKFGTDPVVSYHCIDGL